MRPSLGLFVIYMLFFSCEDRPVVLEDIAKGVPLDLATYRSKQVSAVTYTLSFVIPIEKEAKILSNLKLDLTLANLDAPLYLDFKEESSHLKSIRANGEVLAIHHENEHIKIAPEDLVVGKNKIEIDFLAGELSLNRNDEYLYTLLVPDRARTLFPCFDQPNIKATYLLTITAPADWEVLCGAPKARTEAKDGFMRHEFAPTDNMSTYLFSFVAGKFKKVTQNPGKFDMSLLYRETDTAKIALSTPAIFNLHQRSITFLEDYTAFPFPFQKLDFAAIPGFQYGGMEHVGAIQYRGGALFLDESATENRKLSRAKLIAHETAHMWFGDLVTMDWFNDVWMKEVFANFMADKIVNPAFPDVDHKLAFMTTHYPRAYSEDRTKGTNPIRQKLQNLNDAGSLYGSIIYNKAPIMMRQLEAVLGKVAFKEGIRDYIKTYRNGNAVWNDLIEILDNKTEVDIEKWSAVWVNSASRPIFEELITYDEKDKIASFEIRQHAEDDSKHTWPQSFDITLMYKDSMVIIPLDMNGENLVLSDLIGTPKPEVILYNSNGMGYGVFPVADPDVTVISNIKDNVALGSTYINYYENTLKGSIEPSTALELYSEGLRTEKNELLASLISGYTSALFWTYLTDAERERYQPLVAAQLWSQLKADLPANIKKNLFVLFRSFAYKAPAKEQLYEVWNKTIAIPDLKLNEDDYTEIAMDLALYAHENTEEILNEAAAAISDPDKLKRFNFLLPSLSGDVKVRNTFFESLRSEKNREKESWVLSALNNVNHPLRQADAIALLKPSLELLDEIQKTGDIFFPKGWLNSTVGRYSSAEAYEVVQKFIAENPELNPALVKKLLQASDDLRRVQMLRKN